MVDSNDDKESILVIQTQENTPDQPKKNIFVIETVLNEITLEEYYGFESSLRSITTDDENALPIYRLFRFWILNGHFSEKVLPLPYYIYLIGELQSRVEDNNVSKIEVHESVEDSVRPAIVDVYENIDIDTNPEINVEPKYSNWRNIGKIRNKVKSFIGMILVLFDQIIYRILDRKSKAVTNTIFVPSLTRFRSVKPVLDEMTTQFDIVTDQSLLSRFIHNNSKPHTECFSWGYARQYVSMFCILEQAKYIYDYTHKELIVDKTENELKSEIGRKCDLSPNNVVSHIFGEIYRYNQSKSILGYFIYKQVLQKSKAQNIVVGTGYNPRAEAIWLAAQEEGVSAYDLPHTATLEPPQTGIFTDYTFATGKFAREYIDNYNINQTNHTEVLETGRPYLESLNKSVSECENNVTQPLQIIIATQPFSIRERSEFIRKCILGINALELDAKTRIKIHPSESKEFYEKLLDDEKDIQIVDGDIWKELQTADIILTVNSNVGLESIIAGSLSISIRLSKKWPLPYANEGPVPILDDDVSIRCFFRQLDIERIREITNMQQSFIEREYIISEASKNIANHIESKSEERIN
ncbi:hypothetical protein [Salinibaculum salinum]|uniref:hypothetical protein n=1 Tax=Salinibaculum salinum TaxID=3131996 RepID=UPI0030EE9785